MGARERHPLGAHARWRPRSATARAFALVGVALAVVLVAGLGVTAFWAYNLTSTFAGNAVKLHGEPVAAPPPGIGPYNGEVNLLLVGTDQCEPEYDSLFGNRCKGADAQTINNDVNLLLHIAENPRRVTVISFPRDMMVAIPACPRDDGGTTPASSKAMINTTYERGGLGCAASTITKLTGFDIPFAAKITWGGVIKMTDAIGGVDVCVATHLVDRPRGLDLTPGMHTIKGLEALQFLRTRHGLESGSDLGRISNQQQYMSRLVKKITSEGVLSNPGMLLGLASTAVANITPSESLANPMTLVQIALAAKSVPADQIVFVQYPTGADPANDNRVVPNFSAARVLLAALRANQPLAITGNAGLGSVSETPAPTASVPPPASAAPPAPSATPRASGAPSPTPTSVALPSTISGTTAAQDTCAKGQVYNGRE